MTDLRRKWTKEEERYLRENYENKTAKELSIELSRTKSSIQARVHVLGLGKAREISLRDGKYNLVGMKFGRLTVIADSNTRAENGAVIWECKCQCDNTTDVISTLLLSGVIKSCGCLKSEVVLKNYKINQVEDTHLGIISKKEARPDSVSKIRGVYWNKKKKRWRSEIGFQKQKYFLGEFKNKQDAINARKEAEEKYFKPILDKYAQK